MTSSWGARPKYGDYHIARAEDGSPVLLGEGSFGKTFAAFRSDRAAGREIKTHAALKVLNPHLLQDERKRSQLICEIEALTRVDHPNLIRYIACGEEEGEIFYVMGLCRGGSLVSLVERFGALPERAAALIALQVAGGLLELGRRNMVHRDIKPSNVMLAEEIDASLPIGELSACLEAHESLIRLVDFGLVNLQGEEDAAHQSFAGSPMYASPEQLREQPLDARSDIYSLGMTLWHLVEGKGPFLDRTGTTVANVGEVIGRHLGEDDFAASLPPNLSGEFKRLLAQTIAKKREARTANASELLRAIRGYLSRTAVIPIARAAEAPLAVTPIAKPLDALFAIGRTLSSNRARKSYEAIDLGSKQSMRLTVLAAVSRDESATERRLGQLAGITRSPSCPKALFRVESLLKSEGQFACTEPLFSPVSLSEALKARAAVRRPAPFAEAAHILRPIAEGLDYLLENGHTSALLRSEEIWLGKAGAAGAGEQAPQAQALGAGFKELQVRFSAMFLPPELGEEQRDSFATSTGSLSLSEDDYHPVAAFARLVYRIVNGSEVPAVARLSPEGYAPTVSLNAASNALLRDCINRRKVARNAGSLLEALCANEGVILASGASQRDVGQASTASKLSTARDPEKLASHSGEVRGKLPSAAVPAIRAAMRSRKAQVGLLAALCAGLAVLAALWHPSSRNAPTTSSGRSTPIPVSGGAADRPTPPVATLRPTPIPLSNVTKSQPTPPVMSGTRPVFSAPQLAGVWRDQHLMEIRPDGTFFRDVDILSQPEDGSWKLEGDLLTLTFRKGNALALRIESIKGDDMVFTDISAGKRYASHRVSLAGFDDIKAGSLAGSEFETLGMWITPLKGKILVGPAPASMVLPGGRKQLLLVDGGTTNEIAFDFNPPVRYFAVILPGIGGGASFPTYRLTPQDRDGVAFNPIGQNHWIPTRAAPARIVMDRGEMWRVTLSVDNRFGNGSSAPWATYNCLPIAGIELER